MVTERNLTLGGEHTIAQYVLQMMYYRIAHLKPV